MRTHVREYVQNDAYVNNSTGQLLPVFLAMVLAGQAYGGYLETMFAVLGREVPYRPVDSTGRLADANYVKQRDWRSAQDMMKFTDTA